MTNWLERARREISKSADRPTANTDERNLTAVTAVPYPEVFGKSPASNGSNGSNPSGDCSEIETANEVKEASLADPAAEARRQQVLVMLRDNPGIHYALLTDTEADPQDVILALGIRGVGTCELLIPRAKYDPFRLLKLIVGGLLEKKIRCGAGLIGLWSWFRCPA